jgi:3-hydroxybutyryl-CoA dehydrogenase
VLEHQDMVGLDLGFAVCDYVARDLNNEPKAPELYQQLMAEGHYGARTGKGFHDWSARSAEESRARRDAFVISCLKAGIGRQRG